MEIPEAVPKFLHYPHNHDFSLTFYKEKANQYPVYVTTLITRPNSGVKREHV
jgi:hypothetical protein